MRRRLPLLLALLCPSLCAAEPAAPTPWAFRKPVRVDPPHVSNPDWVQNPIDAFVLARLDKAGLKPSPTGRPRRPAPPRHLRPDRPAADARGGRRLPRRRLARTPTSSVVDRLLASPALRRALGRGTGSTWPATPSPTATRPTPTGPTPGATAITSSAPSTTTSPTTASSTEQLAGDLLARASAPTRRHRRAPDRDRLQPLRPSSPGQRQRGRGREPAGSRSTEMTDARRRRPSSA